MIYCSYASCLRLKNSKFKNCAKTFLFTSTFLTLEIKLGCVVRMVVDSILPHAKSGPNDHRKDAPLFIFELQIIRISNALNLRQQM